MILFAIQDKCPQDLMVSRMWVDLEREKEGLKTVDLAPQLGEAPKISSIA